MASIPIPRRYRTVIYIPSRSDGCMLEVCLSIPTTVPATPQAFTGVVIAHPYGPLGGSYNNNVVGAMLQWFETYPLQATSKDVSSSSSSLSAAVPLACVICAFNFRGCGKSKGRTSWSGHAEREDYQTIVDFLQGGSRSDGFSHSPEVVDASSAHATQSLPPVDSDPKRRASERVRVFDETGHEIDPPRLPSLSRFILSGYSYGGLIASTIPPPLRNPSRADSTPLPTTYIFISLPAGVAWFLTSGMHGSFSNRAKAILQGHKDINNSQPSTPSTPTTPSMQSMPGVEAYFITGSKDQFTSPKTLLSWLKTNAGMQPPKDLGPGRGWSITEPDRSIQLDVVDGVDHFWLDRERELLERLGRWWRASHAQT